MTADPRVGALLDDIAAGLDDPHRRLPEVTRDDAVAIAEVMHGELDRGTEARAQVALAMGHRIACDHGCSACQTVIVTGDGEALRVSSAPPPRVRSRTCWRSAR